MYPHEPGHDVSSELAPVIIDDTPTPAKAIVATVGALTTGIVAALADGHVDVWEIVLGVLLAIGAGATTYAVTNKRN